MINWVRVTGYGFISLSLLIFTLVIAILSAEFLGISSKIVAQYGGSGIVVPLHRTDYYGKPLEVDPYSRFTVQHLHPYYLFSLPWQDKDRLAANNDYVQVDDSGFRVNPYMGANTRIGILLGGSTAFGHFSSSDKTTLAATLTARSGIDFINRNAPSWNSHQELVALVKFPKPYDVSISLSLANDVEIICTNLRKKLRVGDSPESFRKLNSFFNDIRGEPLTTPSSSSVGDAIAKALPDTTELYSLLEKRNAARENAKSGSKSGTVDHAFCGGSEDAVVELFLKNQVAMRQLSEARGAHHFLIIQPQYSLHATSRTAYRRGGDSYRTVKRQIVRKVMESDFCMEGCVDLSALFDKFRGASLIESGGIYKDKVFIDEVHLTDVGVSILSDKIAVELKRLGLGTSEVSEVNR